MNLHPYNFGCTIEANSLGEAWIGLVETCMKNGNLEYDEHRARFALHGVRMIVKGYANHDNDPIIQKYASQESIATMRKLAFEADTVTDFDITPSFRTGAKSYKKRIEEGNLVDFVVHRLTRIPESKKAVMVFPTYEDYKNVKESPFNDYLPCIVSLQFRLHKIKEGQQILFSDANDITHSHPATIFAINKAFEPNEQAVLVHAKINETTETLLPGMYVEARVKIDNTKAMALPTDAIVSNGDEHYIFIQISKNTFKEIRVNIGAADMGYTEVIPIDEVGQTDKVVVKGAYYLLSELTKGSGEE